VSKLLIIYTLIAFTFYVGAQDNMMLQKEYKARIAKQANTYPIKIDENNNLRKSFVDGNTHVIEIQVHHSSKEEISNEDLLQIEDQLIGTLSVNFCLDGTSESAARTIGLSAEYRYFDKNAEPFHSVLFIQQKCDQLAIANSPNSNAEEIRIIEMQISNERGKFASFYVADEYMVNSVMMNLNKKTTKATV
jgi:hypothetical protein